MRAVILCSVISLLIVASSVFSEDAQKAAVKFTSVYTDMQKNCKDKFDDIEEGNDMPVICDGPGDYLIDVEFSACCEFLQVQGGNDFLFIFPPQRFVTVMNRKMEWRLADGKPFAVIFRINKYKDVTLSSKRTGEVLITKGLEGFAHIDHEVDVKLHPNPNQEARRLADQDYKLQKNVKK